MGIWGQYFCFDSIFGFNIATHSLSRATAFCLFTNLRVLCRLSLLLSRSDKHRHDHRDIPRNWYSPPFLQLRWLVTVGIHTDVIYFPAFGCESTTNIQITTHILFT